MPGDPAGKRLRERPELAAIAERLAVGGLRSSAPIKKI